MATRLDETTNADNLIELHKRLELRGFESSLLQIRLKHNEEATVLQQHLSHVYDPEKDDSPERIYPHMLPTQTSGRWSTTNPPLTNFPDDIRDVIWPDPGWPWIVWDLDAIEGKIVAAYTHDRDDLDAFNKNYDIHLITGCRMSKMELPSILTKEIHISDKPEAVEWRKRYGWKGEYDKRRIAAKARYGLLYGRDHRAILGSKYYRILAQSGLTHNEILKASKAFLDSKPNLISIRRKYWDQCARTNEARTILGRRRRLFGDYWSRAKEGWNHMVQGLVVDMTNLAIIDLCQPPNRLIAQAHDGVKVAVPHGELIAQSTGLQQMGLGVVLPIKDRFKQSVERVWEIEGEKIISTASWAIYYPDGTHGKF